MRRWTYGEDEILQQELHLHPVFVGERWPDKVWLGNRELIGPLDDLGLFVVDVQIAE